MKRMMCRSIVLAGLIGLAGCGGLAVQTPGPDTVRPVARPGGGTPPPEDATSVEDFDTTTQAQRVEAATAVSDGEHVVGTTIASLGNAAIPGFWLETPLVSEAVLGRVVFDATGKSAAVQLIPIEGPSTAGSRISLAAQRVLGAPLAGLIELRVFAN
jgi:hypothetical protein